MECTHCGNKYAEVLKLKEELATTRKELKNIRTTLESLKRKQQTFIAKTSDALKRGFGAASQLQDKKIDSFAIMEKPDVNNWKFEAIGIIHSSFRYKNGTPRQPTVCRQSIAQLQLNRSILTNPEHALQGLKQFSHVWILFGFHKNDKARYNKGKVAPPRLDGERIGVFSTRSPHRPNPIGLSLTKIVGVDGDCINLAGVDILDGTPVLDIKPYIPEYDMPVAMHQMWKERCTNLDTYPLLQQPDLPVSPEIGSVVIAATDLSRPGKSRDGKEKSWFKSLESNWQNLPAGKGLCCNLEDVTVANWLRTPPAEALKVHVTDRCSKHLDSFFNAETVTFQSSFPFKNGNEVIRMASDILREDPRSVYRRHHCRDQLYYFEIDTFHVTAWFDVTTSDCSVEILKIGLVEEMK